MRLRDGVGVVGPLVYPGRTACLGCLDRTRGDLDPRWPAVAAQLAGRAGVADPAAVTATVGLAVAQAVAAVEAVDGGPTAALGATLELDVDAGELRRRTWSAHPECPCGAARDRASQRERRHNHEVSDIPRRTAARTAKLASLPLGVAGRAVGGWGRRLVGGDGEEISAQLMAKSAEQLFAVLGELKGGAMKFGQALSVFEAAIPDEYAAPFRESLIKLQTAAPPMPTSDVHRMLAEQFGRGWRARFTEFDETPAAAASIGQVHRGVWHDGRDGRRQGAVPGRRGGAALRPAAAVADEPRAAAARARPGDQAAARGAARPHGGGAGLPRRGGQPARLRGRLRRRRQGVRAEGRRVRAEGDGHGVGHRPEALRRASARAPRPSATTPLCCWPSCTTRRPPRAGLLHADPHPGNFQLLDDGRLLVLDFGAVARLPDGLPRPLSIMVRLALENRPDDLLALLRREGFVLPGSAMTGDDAIAYLAPFTEPLRSDVFRFNRRWLQRQAGRVGDLRSPDFRTGLELNLPPQYLLVHRVTMGTLGVLCQLDADVPLRGIVRALAAVDLRRGRGGHAELTPTKIAANAQRRASAWWRFAAIFGWACDGAPAAGEPGRRRLGAARSRSEPGSEQITGALPMVVGRPPWRGAAGMPRRTATVRRLRGWRQRRPSPRPVDSRTGRASATAVRR